MTNKILLLGRASTGKSSLKCTILEGKDPLILMMKPLDPTRGCETSIHNWMDISLSIFDTSGQELRNFVENSEEQEKVFNNAEIVIYIFDYPSWINDSLGIITEIKEIQELIQKKYSNSKFILILNKIDLINSKKKIHQNEISSKIIKEIGFNNIISLYFTSIYPDLLSQTFNVFFEILSKFSEETKNLKYIIDSYTNNLSKTMVLVTDERSRLIVQSKSPDFEVKYIKKLHDFLKPIENRTSEISALYDRLFFIDQGSQIFSVLISKIDIKGQKFKNLISITELQHSNYLEELKNNLLNDILSAFQIR